MVPLRKRREISRTRPIACKRNSDVLFMADGREGVRSVLSKIRIGIFLLSPSTQAYADDRLRAPDSTTLWYLQIGPEVEKIR